MTLKLVSESHQTWGTFVPNSGTLGLRVLQLFATNTTDGRTDGQKQRLMPPSLRGEGIITENQLVKTNTVVSTIIVPQPVAKGTVSVAFVRLSIAYIANCLRTRMPSVPKFGRKVPHLSCDSHTSFKVKRSKSPSAFFFFFSYACH